MAKKKRKKKGGAGIVLLLVAAIAAGAYFFRDCIPGFGVGGGAGDGANESTEKTDKDKETPSTDGGATISIAVKGDQCVMDGAEPASCDDICTSLKAAGPDGKRVALNGTNGTHAVVESFSKCLEDAKFDVKVTSD